ncbi:MAG: hypothetical protein ABIK83_12870 [Candidatus Zixiibacteriota bacterium]
MTAEEVNNEAGFFRRIVACFTTLTPRDLCEADSVRKAYKFSAEFIPDATKSYKWVYEHGLEQSRLIRMTIDVLDKKAENFVKFLGPTSGILGVGMLWIHNYTVDSSWWVCVLVVLSLLLFMLGLFAALRALTPAPHALLPSVKTAIQSVHYFKTEEEALANVIAGVEMTMAVLAIVSQKKGNCIYVAQGTFVLGFVCLLLSFLLPYVLASVR